jgi:hypothetical protein
MIEIRGMVELIPRLSSFELFGSIKVREEWEKLKYWIQKLPNKHQIDEIVKLEFGE